MLISQGVPLLEGVKQEWGGKTSYFRAKCVKISKTVRDPQLQLMTGSCIRAYKLSIGTKIDDLG